MNFNLRERFPPSEEIILVFASIVFPQYTWTTFWVMNYLPSWLKSMTFWETVPLNAYAYAWVFLESVVILFLLLILAILVPEKLFKRHFVSKSSLAAWLIFVFSFATQLKNTNKYDFMAEIRPEIIILASAIILFFLNSKFQRSNDIIVSIADRLTAFLYIYIPISVISTIIVLYNNFRS
jgi:hypothetical protein